MNVNSIIDKVKFNDDGLVVVITQDYSNNVVLMQAYMNEEALRITLETKEVTYYSRSRKNLWKKGETSGNLQFLKEILVDCDGDSILIKVEQIGVACHLGNYSCFVDTEGVVNYEQFSKLYQTIKERKENPKEGSYTNYLFREGIDKILKKVGEEASEIIIASKNPNQEELIYEIADLVYHMFVLMNEREINIEDIVAELKNREK